MAGIKRGICNPYFRPSMSAVEILSFRSTTDIRQLTVGAQSMSLLQTGINR